MGGLFFGGHIAYRTEGPQRALLHRALLRSCPVCEEPAGTACDFDVDRDGLGYSLVCPERDELVGAGLRSADLLPARPALRPLAA